jgi:hypothetical protein
VAANSKITYRRSRRRPASLRRSWLGRPHHLAMALDLPCPNCGTQMYPEQAHNRCPSCLYFEPCCDGAPQQCRVPAQAKTIDTPLDVSLPGNV